MPKSTVAFIADSARSANISEEESQKRIEVGLRRLAAGILTSEENKSLTDKKIDIHAFVDSILTNPATNKIDNELKTKFIRLISYHAFGDDTGHSGHLAHLTKPEELKRYIEYCMKFCEPCDSGYTKIEKKINKMHHDFEIKILGTNEARLENPKLSNTTPRQKQPKVSKLMDDKQKKELLQGRLDSLDRKCGKPKKKQKLNQGDKDLLEALRCVMKLDINESKINVIAKARKEINKTSFVADVHAREEEIKKNKRPKSASAPLYVANKSKVDQPTTEKKNRRRKSNKRRARLPGQQRPRMERFFHVEHKGEDGIEIQPQKQEIEHDEKNSKGLMKPVYPEAEDQVEIRKKRSMDEITRIAREIRQEEDRTRDDEWYITNSSQLLKSIMVTTNGGRKVEISMDDIFMFDSLLFIQEDGHLDCFLSKKSGLAKPLSINADNFLNLEKRKIHLENLEKRLIKRYERIKKAELRAEKIERIRSDKIKKFTESLPSCKQWPTALRHKDVQVMTSYSVSKDDIEGNDGRLCIGFSSLPKSMKIIDAICGLADFRETMISEAAERGVHLESNDIVLDVDGKRSRTLLSFSIKAVDKLLPILQEGGYQNIVQSEVSKLKEYNKNRSTVAMRTSANAFLRTANRQTRRIKADSKKALSTSKSKFSNKQTITNLRARGIFKSSDPGHTGTGMANTADADSELSGVTPNMSTS